MLLSLKLLIKKFFDPDKELVYAYLKIRRRVLRGLTFIPIPIIIYYSLKQIPLNRHQ